MRLQLPTVWDYDYLPYGITITYRMGRQMVTGWDRKCLQHGIAKIQGMGLPRATV